MMPLLVGQLADLVDERQSGTEVGEFVGAGEVMFVHHCPVRELAMQVCESRPPERRDAALAGDASFVGERSHDRASPDRIRLRRSILFITGLLLGFGER